MKMAKAFSILCFWWFSVLIIGTDSIQEEMNITACPLMCTCSEGSTIVCNDLNAQLWEDTCKNVNDFALEENLLPHLHLKGLSLNTTQSFDCLPRLKSLDISTAKLYTIPSSLKDVEFLQDLDLSSDEIQLLPNHIFLSFGHLQGLNLSHNNISDLNPASFAGLYSLQSLDLSFNNIKLIHPSSFEFLTNLTYLNLGHNRIEHFTSWHLPQSLNLQILIVSNNMLKSLYIGDNETDAISVSQIQSFDISNNPLECTCILQKVLHKVYAQGGVIVNVENTLCDSPMPLKNYSVNQLNETALLCSVPHNLISFPSNKKSVLKTATITLECRAEAYPSPHIMWITPWGEKFSKAPMSLIVHKGLASEDQINFYREYSERNNIMTSSIKISEMNDLIISQFRGSMAGNFSCVAFNEIGSKVEIIHLSVLPKIKSIYHTSLKIASYSASICLMLGFLIGLINILVRKLRHKVYFKVPLFTPAASVHPVEEDPEPFSIYEDFSPPTSPLLGCTSEKSTLSSNYLTELGDSPEKRPHHILDSLEGARERLRDGVGRKMESVRRNVQSIKESTGAYVHTIMESGSSAANKMKAGVVMGVETVKYTVQSVKELCGTGNMGSQTVSIISMETDIDTNQQKSVVRQVTFV